MIKNILDEINLENGSKYKESIFRKYSENKLLQRVLKMTYDTVDFTYGISLKNISYTKNSRMDFDIVDALNILEDEFVTRKVTGNAAISRLEEVLSNLDSDDEEVVRKVINRDLRINAGSTMINKVWPGLITKVVYMRCGTGDKKSLAKLDMTGAIVQLKADGTYREFRVENGDVKCRSRSGETYFYPELNNLFREDGVYTGEMTVYQDGVLLDRARGNGILKKDEFPENCQVMFDCWDIIDLDEYNSCAKNKKYRGTTPYWQRLEKLETLFPPHTSNHNVSPIRVIEYEVVNTLEEAMKFTSRVMNDGLEGSILKSLNGKFRDGTSAEQLKLKLEIDLDVRITGFIEGKIGTKREETFGSMTYATDDGMIKGSVSGFTDAELEDFNNRREDMIGKIITVQANDITQAQGSDTWALSHPRFIEVRDDKTETDTFERAQKIKEMSMNMDNI